jgi:hypothetical protein
MVTVQVGKRAEYWAVGSKRGSGNLTQLGNFRNPDALHTSCSSGFQNDTTHSSVNVVLALSYLLGAADSQLGTARCVSLLLEC